MNGEFLFQASTELKDKFKKDFVHKKKLTALHNISEVVEFKHNDYIKLIKRCLKSGFLSDEENSFLCYLVSKYFSDKNFLDWTHKTLWLKREMHRMGRQYRRLTPVQQDLFNWSKLQEQVRAQTPTQTNIVPIQPKTLVAHRVS